jgi:hypothetical protein
MLELHAHEQVSQDTGIGGNFDLDGIFDCPHRGQSMRVRSDTAGTLHEMMCIPRVASLENEFDAPEHLSRAPCIDNLAAGYLDFYSEVAFYSGDRIDGNLFTHAVSSLIE